MQNLNSEKDNQFWARFLPEIKKIIEGTLAAAAEREAVLASMLEAAPGPFRVGLEEMGTRIEGCTRRLEDTLAAADAPLQEAEEAYRGKLAAIESLRQKLADWAGRSIE